MKTTTVLLLLSALRAASLDESPRLVRGEVPRPPVEAIGGGEVMLEATVHADGKAGEVRVLRDTPPFTAVLTEAVQRWAFEPGGEGAVLVAGLFGPPALYGPAPGQPPREVGAPSPAVPFPTTKVPAPYPPNATGDGTVLVEARVDDQGAVASAKVLQAAPPFDAGALDAARRWRFRPARRNGEAVGSVAYLVFGFRQPVTAPRPNR